MHDTGADDGTDGLAGRADRPITVVLVDDEKFVRRVLSGYFEHVDDITVVGEAAGGEEAVRVVADLRPDLVLMDLQMADVDGVEATRRIVATGSTSKVLVVTGHVSDTFLTRSLLAGASGYLVKDSEPHQIVDGVRGVHAGGQPIDAAVTQHLISELRRGVDTEAVDGPDIEVNEREHDVLEALCTGQSNREIASALYISEPTVKYYLAGLMRKFGTRGRVELVVAALRRGLVR